MLGFLAEINCPYCSDNVNCTCLHNLFIFVLHIYRENDFNLISYNTRICKDTGEQRKYGIRKLLGKGLVFYRISR